MALLFQVVQALRLGHEGMEGGHERQAAAHVDRVRRPDVPQQVPHRAVDG